MAKEIIVIENFHTPTICTDRDGDILYFSSIEEAENYSDKNCQCGTVVEVNSF